MRLVGALIEKSRKVVEELPVTPANLAELAIRRHSSRRRRIAATDPTWSEIEARRRRGGPGVLFLSADAGLGFAEWETQRNIETRLCPDPVWMPAAQRVRHWKVSRVVGTLRTARQRATRSWADSDAWSGGRHLAKVTAEMLEHLAENAHGWPRSEAHPTMEDWTTDLRHNAALLRRWVEGHGEDELRSRWYAAASSGAAAAGAAEKLSTELAELEAANLDAARTALRWVAENVEALWD